MGKKVMTMKELNDRAISELKSSYKNAKKYFLMNAKRNPSYITYNNLAWYYFKCEELNPFQYDLYRFNKSTEYCMKALELKPNVSSLRLLRDIHYAKKEYGRAKEIYDQIIESDMSIDDYYVMGCIYLGMNNFESAEGHLKKAYDYYYSKTAFEDDYAYISFALCLIRLGKLNEANEIADYLLKEIHNTINVDLVNILMIYYYTNNFEKIEEYTEELRRGYDVQEDILAMILMTYKEYYSEEEYEKRFIDIIQNKKELNEENGWKIKGGLILLEKVHEQINMGRKPELNYEPRRYFLSNYIEIH